MNLENILLSKKKPVTKRPYNIWFLCYEMSGIGKSKETERLVVVRLWGEEIANGYGVSFWGDGNVLKLTVVIVPNSENTKNH